MGDVMVLDAPAGGISGPELAETLGVTESTVCRWAYQLGYPHIGSGRHRRFTSTDLLICQAWQVLSGTDPQQRAVFAEVRLQAAAAVRRRPARWLVVTPYCGFTHPEAEEATVLALQLKLRCWWLIDLWSRRG